MKPGPSQSKMLLPMLSVIEEERGKATTKVLYEGVKQRLGLDEEVRQGRITIKSKSVNVFERSVRWTQQKARSLGYTKQAGKDRWALTEDGRQALTKSSPGLVVTVWVTDAGQALWGDCQDAVGMLGEKSVNLIMTSPPYPLESRQKDYGNKTGQGYLDWMLKLADQWGKVLTEDGSLVLNLADTWTKGAPCLSLYQERLLVALHDKGGWHLCQRLQWYNPARLPSPAAFVTVRRIRVKPAVEQLFWLSRSKNPYADNRAVQQEYGQGMRDAIKAGGQAAASHPSGHELTQGAFGKDNGGSIPPNLIIAANTASNDPYTVRCKSAGLPVHPARFPRTVPDFFIKLLTRRDDLVLDPFAGSCTVAEAAERLGRRWIACDQVLEYIRGGACRFTAGQTPA